MQSDFAALWYLESCRLANHVRAIVRSPLRTIAWSLGILWVAFMIVTRTLFAARHQQHIIADPLASVAFFAGIVVASLPLLYAAMGKIAAFDAVADARFLVGSALHERNVLFWLQWRNSASLVARSIVFALIYILVSPNAVRPLPTLATVVGYCVFVVCGWIPMLRFRTAFGSVPATIVALGLAATGAIPLALIGLGWIDPRFESIVHGIESLGAGRFLASMLSGKPIPIATLFVISATLVVLATSTARDLYPELYAASLAFSKVGQRMGSQRARSKIIERETAARLHVVSASPTRWWNGGFAIVWRDWLVLQRQNLAMLKFFGWPLLAVFCGVLFGTGMGGREFARAAGPGIVNGVIIGITMYSATSFANDVGKPLWWLSNSNLRGRLYATLVSQSWFLALCIAIALTLAVGLSGMSEFIIPMVLVAIVTALLLRASGMMLYAIFPSLYDQRGPIALLRLLVLYILLAPVHASWIVTFLITHNIRIASSIATAISAVETVALIELASIRLRGAGAAIARAELAE